MKVLIPKSGRRRGIKRILIFQPYDFFLTGFVLRQLSLQKKSSQQKVFAPSIPLCHGGSLWRDSFRTKAGSAFARVCDLLNYSVRSSKNRVPTVSFSIWSQKCCWLLLLVDDNVVRYTSPRGDPFHDMFCGNLSLPQKQSVLSIGTSWVFICEPNEPSSRSTFPKELFSTGDHSR